MVFPKSISKKKWSNSLNNSARLQKARSDLTNDTKSQSILSNATTVQCTNTSTVNKKPASNIPTMSGISIVAHDENPLVIHESREELFEDKRSMDEVDSKELISDEKNVDVRNDVGLETTSNVSSTSKDQSDTIAVSENVNEFDKDSISPDTTITAKKTSMSENDKEASVEEQKSIEIATEGSDRMDAENIETTKCDTKPSMLQPDDLNVSKEEDKEPNIPNKNAEPVDYLQKVAQEITRMTIDMGNIAGSVVKRTTMPMNEEENVPNEINLDPTLSHDGTEITDFSRASMSHHENDDKQIENNNGEEREIGDNERDDCDDTAELILSLERQFLGLSDKDESQQKYSYMLPDDTNNDKGPLKSIESRDFSIESGEFRYAREAYDDEASLQSVKSTKSTSSIKSALSSVVKSIKSMKSTTKSIKDKTSPLTNVCDKNVEDLFESDKNVEEVVAADESDKNVEEVVADESDKNAEEAVVDEKDKNVDVTEISNNPTRSWDLKTDELLDNKEMLTGPEESSASVSNANFDKTHAGNLEVLEEKIKLQQESSQETEEIISLEASPDLHPVFNSIFSSTTHDEIEVLPKETLDSYEVAWWYEKVTQGKEDITTSDTEDDSSSLKEKEKIEEDEREGIEQKTMTVNEQQQQQPPSSMSQITMSNEVISPTTTLSPSTNKKSSIKISASTEKNSSEKKKKRRSSLFTRLKTIKRSMKKSSKKPTADEVAKEALQEALKKRKSGKKWSK